MPNRAEVYASPAQRAMRAAHARERSTKKADPFYSCQQWREFRARMLKRFGHRCAVEGCTTQATHLDHVESRAKAPHRAFDPMNVQALCHSHHSSKTATQDGGFGHATHAEGPSIA